MSYTIKNNISFDEYNAIINKVIDDCFVGGVYSSALYELSLRVSLISAFVPDYDLSDCKDNNALWDKLTSDECKEIFQNIYGTIIYDDIVSAIIRGVNHRLRVIESSPMSLSDIALSKLIDVVTAKIDRGLISKSNRATRRKTTKGNKNISVTTNVIPADSDSKTDTDK